MNRNADFPAPTLVSLGNSHLEVFEAGRENRGNPIVLCHGWPEHAYSWRHQIPALAAAGYHVIVPNQRGYGNSSRPTKVEDYDIAHLTGDLAALLDHFGYEAATFVGHDCGANVVWSMALLHPARVTRIINLALPYQPRTPVPWIEFMESVFGLTTISSTSTVSPVSRTLCWMPTPIASYATCSARTCRLRRPSRA
jgi:pimeloyl-ACP methyl ester carboxylesterase